jgi:hypothetical protein
MSTWLLGDIEYARRLIEQAVRDAIASNDVVTITQVYFFEAVIEAIREHPAATRRAGERACEFSREHGVVFLGPLRRFSRLGRAAVSSTQRRAQKTFGTRLLSTSSGRLGFMA